MMSILFFLTLLNIRPINGILLINTDPSSIIVVRHIRLMTDHEYYRIRCPYRLKHLTITLLNYSNDYCFQLQTNFFDEQCHYHQSPCRFHAKPKQLDCQNQAQSNQVDITYQCSSFKSTNMTPIFDEKKTILSSTSQFQLIPLRNLSFEMEESFGIFLVGLIMVFILWLTVCSIWLFRCGQNQYHDEDDGKCELISIRPYEKSETIDLTIVSSQNSMIVGNLYGQTNTGGIDNICLHVNPLENKLLSSSSSSSLKITQID